MSDGLAEELISMLGRVHGLRVPARTSSFAYKGRNVDVRQIARDLDVAVVLEGAVRGAGERIRATAQLVDGATGYQLWSQSYDRQFTDLFGLQDDLATSIVRAVSDHLHVELPSKVGQGAPTQDLQANELYLQARSLISRSSAGNLRAAGVLLRRAIQRDPGFAAAYAALGAAHLNMYLASMSFDFEDLNTAEGVVQQALSINPGFAIARSLKAQISGQRGNWIGAREAYGAALAVDGQEPTLHLGLATLLYETGQVRMALAEARDADRLAPGLGAVGIQYATVYSILGMDSEAVRYTEHAVNLGASPDLPSINIVLSHAAYRRGDFEEAATHVMKVMPAEVCEAGGVETIRLVYAAFGDSTRTAAAIDALRSLGASREGSQSSMKMMLLAHWYTMLGALDPAYETVFAFLTRLRDVATVGGAVWVGLWLPEMRPFRSDARFQSLVDALNMTEYWREYGPPDGCKFSDGRVEC